MGVTAMEFKAALATVKVAPREMLPTVAVIVEVPRAIPFARAGVPFILMPATAGLVDAHCAEAVISCVLPSVNVPVAVNCKVAPSNTDPLPGEIASDTSVGAVTVSVALPLTPENMAVMVADPGPLLVAMPLPAIVTALVFDELQVAELVRSLLVWSLYVPVALNCWPSPAAIEDEPGVIWIDCKAAAPPAVGAELALPPHPAMTPRQKSPARM